MIYSYSNLPINLNLPKLTDRLMVAEIRFGKFSNHALKE